MFFSKIATRAAMAIVLVAAAAFSLLPFQQSAEAASNNRPPEFVPVKQQRLLDTRRNNNPFGNAETRGLQVGGQAGIPTRHVVEAVVLNVTAVSPDRPPFVMPFSM